jgi:phage major head subunit gpT-like protein
MTWESYSLDRIAQKLVLSAKINDNKTKQKDQKSLNQSFKMRETVAYGLERFWGEHLRLQTKYSIKSDYWKKTWDALVELMAQGGVTIPNDTVKVDNTAAVEEMAKELWKLDIETQRITLAVLTQLCDSMVWWTQRYRGSTQLTPDDEG